MLHGIVLDLNNSSKLLQIVGQISNQRNMHGKKPVSLVNMNEELIVGQISNQRNIHGKSQSHWLT